MTITKAQSEGVKSVVIKGKKILLNPAAQRIFDRIEDLIHTKSIRKISARIGKDPEWVAKRVRRLKDSRELRKAVDKLGPKLLMKGAGKVFVGLEVIAGVDILSDWYVLDNVIGGSKFRIMHLVEMAENRQMTPDEAQEFILEQMETLETAEGYVDTSMKYNPFVWMAKKLWKAGIESDKAAIDDQLFKLQAIRTEIAAEEAEEAEKKMRTFRGVERTEEESTFQEKSFMASQEKIEEGKRQKEFDLKRKEQEAQSAERAKMRSGVGIGALSRPPVEQKKRRVPSKLKFGI